MGGFGIVLVIREWTTSQGLNMESCVKFGYQEDVSLELVADILDSNILSESGEHQSSQ